MEVVLNYFSHDERGEPNVTLLEVLGEYKNVWPDRAQELIDNMNCAISSTSVSEDGKYFFVMVYPKPDVPRHRPLTRLEAIKLFIIYTRVVNKMMPPSDFLREINKMGIAFFKDIARECSAGILALLLDAEERGILPKEEKHVIMESLGVPIDDSDDPTDASQA